MKEKEVKTFFGNDNRLNKGYRRLPNPRESDSNFYRKKFEHILPPIDVMNEYENIHPGTLERLLDMAEQEQHHRHAIDLVNVENHNRAIKLGRKCAMSLVAGICVTSVMLAIFAGAMAAIIFPLAAFLAICMTSLLAHLKSTRKRSYEGTHRNEGAHRNNNASYHRKR